MSIEITMPRLSDTMEEGTLVKWHVAVGDKIVSGAHLADVETDKATMELNAFDDGTVAKIHVEEGATAPVGSVILVLAEEGESVDEVAAASTGSAPKAEDAKSAPASDDAEESDAKPADRDEDAAEDAGAEGGDRQRVSPLARKLAEEHGVDLAKVRGTGPEGRIIKRDILTAAKEGTGKSAGKSEAKSESKAAPSAAPAPAAAAPAAMMHEVPTLEAKSIPLTGMRKTIAKRLVESKTTVPHFQVSVAVDVDPLMALRQTLNQQLEAQGVKLSVNDFITRAVALAAAQHPAVNSSWSDSAIVQHGTVNVGVAVSLPAEKGGGLLVATVRDAHAKGLRQISAQVKGLATKARTSGLSPEEMSDSTITLSNLGMPQYGVTQFTAIVNPPNAAIIAVGAALEKPVVRRGQIVIGHEMNVTLSGDHRVIDGAVGAEYLATLKQLLENPASLLV